MKIAPRQIAGFIEKPGATIRAGLFFGADEGLVRERASQMAAGHVPDVADAFCVADLTGPDIIKDPARLADEANALSLTGGNRLVRLRGATDGIAEALRYVLEAPSCVALIVIEAGALSAKGALRKLVEGSKLAGVVGCYADEAGDVAGVIRETLRGHGLSASADAIGYLAGNLRGDRRVIRGEIDKLALYAAGQEAVSLEDAQASVVDSAGIGLDDVVMAAAEGDHAGLDRALGKLLLEGTNPVAVLRVAARHMQRLHQASALVANGRAPREAMRALRPPVFFKQVDRFAAQLRFWKPADLGPALERLIDAEIKCKSTGAPAQAICSRALMTIANAANRRRRAA